MAVPDDTIYLEQMELGPMQNFVYLIGDPQSRECVVVDPAWEIDTIVERAQTRGMMYTCQRPDRFDWNAMCRPSGAHDAL